MFKAFDLGKPSDISICGKCRFINKNTCMNPFSFSFQSRVLDGYISCTKFSRRPEEKQDCSKCHLGGDCPMTPDTCPGAIDKKQVEMVMQDSSPMGEILRSILLDLKPNR
jgi:hypothetical protein